LRASSIGRGGHQGAAILASVTRRSIEPPFRILIARIRSMRLAALLVAGLAIASAAQAEDFTGFYAGVNAGYGFGRGADARQPTSLPGPEADAVKQPGLPPSAAGAARALRAGQAPTHRYPKALQ